jgi:hypothetical protein
MKTKPLFKLLWLGGLSLLLLLTLSACGPQATPTSVAEYISTQVEATLNFQATQDMAEMLVARMTQQAIPTATFTPLPTATPLATLTPLPTATSKPATAVYVPPAVTSTPASSNLCLHATLISDGDIPDGTEMSPNQTFTKSWTFKNTGTCTWTTEFDIFFVSGDQMSAPSVLDFPQTVQPGQSVTISIPMVAPSAAGTYTGYWNIADQGGKRFGIGADGTGNFSETIVVK